MSTHPQRARDNILPLSVGSTLPDDYEEGSFTELTEDHGHPIETCAHSTRFGHRFHDDSATCSTIIRPGQSERSDARFSG